MIHNFRPLVYDFFRSGGEWLGSARTWMQSNYSNGDTVFWGTEDELKGVTRVHNIEELASIVAQKTFTTTVERLSKPYRILEFIKDVSVEYDCGLRSTITYKAGERIRIELLNHDYQKNEITFKTYSFSGTLKLDSNIIIMPYENSL